MLNFKNETNGVTLIALIVTIIILLILAVVSFRIITGDNGIINKAETAKSENDKAAATETMNLKITNVQISKYAEEQRMPTLKELADNFCEDNDFEYVREKTETASLTKILNENPTAIIAKLKTFPYEFEIDSELKLASIDGVKVASNTTPLNNCDHISDIINDFTPSIKIDGNKVKVSSTASNDVKGYIYFVNDKVNVISTKNEEELLLDYNSNYKIYVYAIDENGKIKKSSETNITTGTKINIFDGTETDTTITGGFNSYFTRSNSYNYANYTSYKSKNCFLLISPDSGMYATIISKKAIDVTNLSSITFDFSAETNHNDLLCNIYMGISENSNFDNNFIRQNKIENTKTINETNLSIDVSDLTGEYYLKYTAYHATNVTNYGVQAYLYGISAHKVP